MIVFLVYLLAIYAAGWVITAAVMAFRDIRRNYRRRRIGLVAVHLYAGQDYFRIPATWPVVVLGWLATLLEWEDDDLGGGPA